MSSGTKSAETFIRGGQTTQHWLRMAGQVVRGTIIFGVLVFGAVYTILCLNTYELAKIHETLGYEIARFMVEVRGSPNHEVRYKDADLGWITRAAEVIYLDAGLRELSANYQAKASELAWLAVPPGVLAGVIAAIVFVVTGRGLQQDTHIRGTRLVSRKDLERWSRAKWKDYARRFGKGFKKAPRYTIAGIPFPPNAVEAQTSICGTVGTGKSNAIKELLDTVRQLNGKAIIYDRMGAYVRDFYDPSCDVILNPLDHRSRGWSPFLEAQTPSFFTQLAEVFIPDRPGASEPFWSQAARIVFDYAAQEIYRSGNWSNARLRDAILQIPSDQLAALIQATPGHHFFNEEISKTADSIRANLIAELRFLEHLRDDGDPFSIREWVKDDNKRGFVFLTGNAEQAAATRNLISACFEVAANALMTSGETNDPRIWFIMDEVPTLNRMPFLPKSLAEIRQFGGAFVVGYQVYSQLEDIYGDKAAQTIVGNLNNRIVFNTPDADTAEHLSKSLGSEDVEERRENITVGAHESRDGVGFMSHRTERRVVTPSQIQSLAQFQGYIRFAYDAPTAFVEFDPYSLDGAPQPTFVAYGGSDRGDGAMTSEAMLEGAGTNPSAWEQDKEEHEGFEQYRARMVDAGLALYATDAGNDATLMVHFRKCRAKGFKLNDIGPPARVVPMLGRAEPARSAALSVNENIPHIFPPAPKPEPETSLNAVGKAQDISSAPAPPIVQPCQNEDREQSGTKAVGVAPPIPDVLIQSGGHYTPSAPEHAAAIQSALGRLMRT